MLHSRGKVTGRWRIRERSLVGVVDHVEGGLAGFDCCVDGVSTVLRPLDLAVPKIIAVAECPWTIKIAAMWLRRNRIVDAVDDRR